MPSLKNQIEAATTEVFRQIGEEMLKEKVEQGHMVIWMYHSTKKHYVGVSDDWVENYEKVGYAIAKADDQQRLNREYQVIFGKTPLFTEH